MAGVGAEGLRLRDGPVVQTMPCALPRGSRQVELMTQQLRQLHPSELQDEEARALLEARDLEDILFRS